MSARIKIKPVDPREFTTAPPPRAVAGRRPKLTPDARRNVIERYRLHKAHHPDRICADYGITRSTLHTIISGHRYRDES